ncbi:TPA: sigma-70 region 4 domain-containing protein [Escherichia coli]|nr:sigma-70 region 4 domain-containing protein [Escherichia coli]HDS7611730.1 sigma-70 region 4 domain-containing protein [Escherichia coli]
MLTNHDENKQLFGQIQSKPTMMTEILRLRATGLSYLEIAAKTGLTKNNVAQYLHRAKKLYAGVTM